MRYRETVRFTNTWPEMDEYEIIEMLVSRGRYQRAIELMLKSETRTPETKRDIRYTVLEKCEPTDTVIHKDGKHFLCASHKYGDEVFAYYLVEAVEA